MHDCFKKASDGDLHLALTITRNIATMENKSQTALRTTRWESEPDFNGIYSLNGYLFFITITIGFYYISSYFTRKKWPYKTPVFFPNKKKTKSENRRVHKAVAKWCPPKTHYLESSVIFSTAFSPKTLFWGFECFFLRVCESASIRTTCVLGVTSSNASGPSETRFFMSVVVLCGIKKEKMRDHTCFLYFFSPRKSNWGQVFFRLEMRIFVLVLIINLLCCELCCLACVWGYILLLNNNILWRLQPPSTHLGNRWNSLSMTRQRSIRRKEKNKSK